MNDPAFSGDTKSEKMKVQETESLKILARKAKKDPKAFSYEVYEELEKSNLLDGSGEYWGHPVKDCIEDKAVVFFMEALERLGVHPSSANIDLLFSLIIMLDGDCPECGSDLEVDEEKTEYKHVFGDGYNDPMEYEPIFEAYKCTCCDYSESR